MQLSPAAQRIDRTLDACFDLSLDEGDQEIVDAVRRVVADHLTGLSVAANGEEACRAALRAVQELGLAELAQGAMDQPDAFRKLALAAEELGAGDLEVGIAAILPAMAIILAGAGERCPTTNRVVERLVRGCLQIAIAIPSPIEKSVFRCFGHSDATHLVVIGSSVGYRRIVQYDAKLSRRIPDLDMELLRSAEIVVPDWRDTESVSDRSRPGQSKARRTVYAAVLFCALIAGAMRASVNFAFKYARSRRSFGKPIITHQAVSLRLAHMLTTAEGTKLLLLQELSRLERGASTQAPPDLLRQTRWAAKELFRDCIQVCGAHGYVMGTIAPRFFQAGVCANAILDALGREIGPVSSGGLQ